MLHGLSSLSAPAAAALARHNGLLELGMLEPLADDIALILSTFQYELYFETKCISDTPGHLAFARRLVYPEFGHHDFNWLESISDEAAEILYECSNFLWMGLACISDAAAASLRKHRGELYLPDLKSLSDKAAEHLGDHEGLLVLTGLDTLSEPAARSLARLEQGLMLSRSIQISEGSAQTLAGCRLLCWSIEIENELRRGS